jgi:hypothetical protein
MTLLKKVALTVRLAASGFGSNKFKLTERKEVRRN